MSSIPQRQCAHCGLPLLFDPNHPHKKYCSRTCSGAVIRTLSDKACQYCGAMFRPARASTAYCSKPCADAMHREHIPHECVCEECGATFISDQSCRNRFCTMACYRAHQARTKRWFDKACEFCSTAFRTNRPEARFCCRRCATDYDSQQGCVTLYCDGCGSTIERYKAKVVAGFNFCCAECRATWSGRTIKVECRGCGVVFRVLPGKSRIRQFCGRACYQQWLHAQTASKLECRVVDALRANGITVLTQFPLRGFIYDCAIEDWRVLIEVDGTYWHSLPDAIRRDRAKDIVAYRSGWRLIRIPEADLATDWDATIDRALRAIRE